MVDRPFWPLAGLWLLCQLVAIYTAIRGLWALFTNRDRLWHILVCYDVLGNAAANDDQVQTLSIRTEKAAGIGKPWALKMCAFLNLVDPGHCQPHREQ